MSDSVTKQLVAQFEASAQRIEEISTALTGFTSVLNSLNEQIKKVDSLSAYFNENDISSEIETNVSRYEQVQQKIAGEVATINRYMQEINELRDSYTTSSVNTVKNFKEVHDAIIHFNTEIRPFVKDIVAGLNELQKTQIPAIDKSLVDEVKKQLVTVKEMNANNFKLVRGYAKEMDRLLEVYRENMAGFGKNFTAIMGKLSDEQKKLLNEFPELLQQNRVLNSSIEEIRSETRRSNDALNNIFNYWAKSNLRPWALKAGGRKRLMLRLISYTVISFFALYGFDALLFNSMFTGKAIYYWGRVMVRVDMLWSGIFN